MDFLTLHLTVTLVSQYSSIDKSFIARYVLHHYWEWSVTLFPTWMAPNLITLLGLCFVFTNFLCILVFVPDLLPPEPNYPWLYLSFAVGIWMYSTFHNVDGKQARRTGCSSPLGELFDQLLPFISFYLIGLPAVFE